MGLFSHIVNGHSDPPVIDHAAAVAEPGVYRVHGDNRYAIVAGGVVSLWQTPSGWGVPTLVEAQAESYIRATDDEFLGFANRPLTVYAQVAP